MPLRTAQCQQREGRLCDLWGPASSNLWQGSGPNADSQRRNRGLKEGDIRKRRRSDLYETEVLKTQSLVPGYRRAGGFVQVK